MEYLSNKYLEKNNSAYQGVGWVVGVCGCHLGDDGANGAGLCYRDKLVTKVKYRRIPIHLLKLTYRQYMK